MLRYKTDRTWFICVLRHPTRKQSGSILTTQEPAWGTCGYVSIFVTRDCTMSEDLTFHSCHAMESSQFWLRPRSILMPVDHWPQVLVFFQGYWNAGCRRRCRWRCCTTTNHLRPWTANELASTRPRPSGGTRLLSVTCHTCGVEHLLCGCRQNNTLGQILRTWQTQNSLQSRMFYEISQILHSSNELLLCLIPN